MHLPDINTALYKQRATKQQHRNTNGYEKYGRNMHALINYELC